MKRKDEIRKITLLGLWINILLSVLKFVIGYLGNSQAVIADAAHSLSDTSTDFLILFGSKYWTAPPDIDHQYGHQKIESLITILIGLFLFFAACGIGYNAVFSISGHCAEDLKFFTLVAPLLSIIFKEFIYRRTYQTGIRINSSAVKANAWHHRTDSLSSIPVLIAVGASLINPELIFLDRVGALIVAVFIVRLSLKIIFKNTNELLDVGISSEEMESISKVIEKNTDVGGYHKIRTRRLGSSVYIDLHLEVDGNLTVSKGHRISEAVKDALIKGNSKIIDVMIHLEPKKENGTEQT